MIFIAHVNTVLNQLGMVGHKWSHTWQSAAVGLSSLAVSSDIPLLRLYQSLVDPQSNIN